MGWIQTTNSFSHQLYPTHCVPVVLCMRPKPAHSYVGQSILCSHPHLLDGPGPRHCTQPPAAPPPPVLLWAAGRAGKWQWAAPDPPCRTPAPHIQFKAQWKPGTKYYKFCIFIIFLWLVSLLGELSEHEVSYYLRCN